MSEIIITQGDGPLSPITDMVSPDQLTNIGGDMAKVFGLLLLLQLIGLIFKFATRRLDEALNPRPVRKPRRKRNYDWVTDPDRVGRERSLRKERRERRREREYQEGREARATAFAERDAAGIQTDYWDRDEIKRGGPN